MQTEPIKIDNDIGRLELHYSYNQTPLGTEFHILTGVKFKADADSDDCYDVPLDDVSKPKYKDLLAKHGLCPNVYFSMQEAMIDERTWHDDWECEKPDLVIKNERVA